MMKNHAAMAVSSAYCSGRKPVQLLGKTAIAREFYGFASTYFLRGTKERSENDPIVMQTD